MLNHTLCPGTVPEYCTRWTLMWTHPLYHDARSKVPVGDPRQRLHLMLGHGALIRPSLDSADVSTPLEDFKKLGSNNHYNLVPILGVTEEDLALFKQAQEKANAAMNLNTTTPLVPSTRSPPLIQFGRYEIVTWYSSPYPQEYARYKNSHVVPYVVMSLFCKGPILLSFGYVVVCYTAVLSVVTQREEEGERCVTILKTAV